MTTSSLYPYARHTDPPELHRSALLVIDLQQLFTSPQQPAFVPDTRDSLRRVQTLLIAFRRVQRPVVYTRHVHDAPPQGPGMGTWWSSFVLEGTAASRLDPALEPADGEIVLSKKHYSAFRETELESWLRAKGVDTVVLAGTMTHICVDTTARDAFMHGFNVVIVTDACASKHRALHEAALHGLSHAVARLSASQTLIQQLASLE